MRILWIFPKNSIVLFLLWDNQTIVKDPVSTRYGGLFEKEQLNNYFNSVKSYKDPISLKIIDPNKDIYSNKAIKLLIKRYFNDNPWAYDYIDEDDIEISNIKFEIESIKKVEILP